jgi:hypothetical protein
MHGVACADCRSRRGAAARTPVNRGKKREDHSLPIIHYYVVKIIDIQHTNSHTNTTETKSVTCRRCPLPANHTQLPAVYVKVPKTNACLRANSKTTLDRMSAPTALPSPSSDIRQQLARTPTAGSPPAFAAVPPVSILSADAEAAFTLVFGQDLTEIRRLSSPPPLLHSLTLFPSSGVRWPVRPATAPCASTH